MKSLSWTGICQGSHYITMEKGRRNNEVVSDMVSMVITSCRDSCGQSVIHSSSKVFFEHRQYLTLCLALSMEIFCYATVFSFEELGNITRELADNGKGQRKPWV